MHRRLKTSTRKSTSSNRPRPPVAVSTTSTCSEAIPYFVPLIFLREVRKSCAELREKAGIKECRSGPKRPKQSETFLDEQSGRAFAFHIQPHPAMAVAAASLVLAAFFVTVSYGKHLCAF